MLKTEAPALAKGMLLQSNRARWRPAYSPCRMASGS